MCHLIIQTLTIQDFFPLIGTLATVVTGYKLISVQVRKNRRAKWIEDFRKEIAILIPLFNRIQDSNDLNQAFNSMLLINMYLDEKKSEHQRLINLMSETQVKLTTASFHPEAVLHVLPDLNIMSNQILILAKEIVKVEQAKI